MYKEEPEQKPRVAEYYDIFREVSQTFDGFTESDEATILMPIEDLTQLSLFFIHVSEFPWCRTKSELWSTILDTFEDINSALCDDLTSPELALFLHINLSLVRDYNQSPTTCMTDDLCDRVLNNMEVILTRAVESYIYESLRIREETLELAIIFCHAIDAMPDFVLELVVEELVQVDSLPARLKQLVLILALSRFWKLDAGEQVDTVRGDDVLAEYYFMVVEDIVMHADLEYLVYVELSNGDNPD